MCNPILIAALVEDWQRRCPCGIVAQQPYDLCREFQAVAAWRRETERTRRRGAPNRIRAGTLTARLLAQVASLFPIISKEAKS